MGSWRRDFNKLQHLSSKMVGSSGTETGFLMAAFQPIATPLQQNGWFQWNREWGKGGEAQQASQVEMKLDYLRLCSRASDNPGFIWFCDFPSIAGRLLCDELGEHAHHVLMKATAQCISRNGLRCLFFSLLSSSLLSHRNCLQ